MRVYEYRCETCGLRFSVVFWPPDQLRPRCRRCGSTQARRLVSRVAVVRGEGDRLERLADNASGLGDSDPSAVERWARELGAELGEDFREEAVDAEA